MSAASSLLTEDQFLCSICLNVFTDPLTIPCGHNFCKTCITDHWDINYPYQCPNCRKAFNTKPELQVNTLISEMVAQFKHSAQLIPEEVRRDAYSGSKLKTWLFILLGLMFVFMAWVFSEQMKLKAHLELMRVRRYAVDVTLDPDTKNLYLILSDDGKQVKLGDVWEIISSFFRLSNPKRFDDYLYVLAKQSVSSGRFYYEVQVKGKTEWTLGVARESINRKGQITLSPQKGYWTIWLRNDNEYKAAAGPDVLLSLKSRPQKVGVFVDYEEGLVSFYDVDAAALIYSFTGCSFTEKLYPFFSPEPYYGGKNSAPLIISPVCH